MPYSVLVPEWLKVFLAVVQHGSFNKAAKALLMTQPAVSQRIRHLEQLLGVRLFERTLQGARLTPEGERLFRYAQAVHWLLLAAESHLSRPHPEASRRLLLGATPTVSFYCLPEWLHHFHQAYPNVVIHLQTGTTPQLVQQVVRHMLPLALVEGELPENAPVTAVPLRALHFVIVAPDRAPWNTYRRLPLRALHSQPFITRPQGTQTRRWMEDLFQRLDVAPRIVAELDSPEAIKHAVARGLGLSLLPRCLLERAPEQGLHLIEIEHGPLVRHIKAIWERHQAPPPLAQAFLQSLRQVLEHEDRPK